MEEGEDEWVLGREEICNEWRGGGEGAGVKKGDQPWTHQKNARENSGGSQTRRDWIWSLELELERDALVAGGRAPNAERVVWLGSEER